MGDVIDFKIPDKRDNSFVVPNEVINDLSELSYNVWFNVNNSDERNVNNIDKEVYIVTFCHEKGLNMFFCDTEEEANNMYCQEKGNKWITYSG